MLLVSCAPCCFVLHAAAVMSASSCPLGSNPGLMGSLCSTGQTLREKCLPWVFFWGVSGCVLRGITHCCPARLQVLSCAAGAAPGARL